MYWSPWPRRALYAATTSHAPFPAPLQHLATPVCIAAYVYLGNSTRVVLVGIPGTITIKEIVCRGISHKILTSQFLVFWGGKRPDQMEEGRRSRPGTATSIVVVVPAIRKSRSSGCPQYQATPESVPGNRGSHEEVQFECVQNGTGNPTGATAGYSNMHTTAHVCTLCAHRKLGVEQVRIVRPGSVNFNPEA
eukprot:2072309-Rhodomonas_salina.2